MRGLKRSLWLLAWVAWAWLGVGLYRALPRLDGRPICKLALEKEEWIDRLVVGTSLAVSRSISPDGVRMRRVWDLRTGELSKEPLDQGAEADDRDFLEQRGPKNEREDQVEAMLRYLGIMRSTDGRVELSAVENIVKEIDTGRVIDEGCNDRSIIGGNRAFGLSLSRAFEAIPGGDVYGCREYWHGNIGSAKTFKSTFAIHSLADGRLLYRLRQIPIWVTSDARLCIDDEATVHALPPPPNWGLLAICQTMLALPIVLLWAVLRWRRRRARQMAAVA